MKVKKTQRGFAYKDFKDYNGNECTIQKSSLATDDAIWLGAKKLILQEFVAFRQPEAWKTVELENTMEHHFVANDRMHLTRKQVAKLIPILQKFVDTGDLCSSS